MKPEQFYRDEDDPSPAARKRMWNIVATRTNASMPFLSIRDGRSFLYGMAASFLLLLSVAGAWTILERTMRAYQPAELRFDSAYQSAIEEFENALPSLSLSSRGVEKTEAVKAKFQQLVLIDAAIKDLRSDLAHTDLSAVKQSRLRQLYSMKLQVLQDLIEQGDLRS